MTTAQTEARFFYPNRMGRIILHSMRIELGPAQLLAVVQAAGHERLLSPMPLGNFEKNFPFQTLSALMAATEPVFGVRAGRQPNPRGGRAPGHGPGRPFLWWCRW